MKIWKNKNGFTLIELLAVITILGILMVIAVPSINAIITNSRKNVYITDAKTYISDARNSIVAQEFDTNDLDTTYYIHINNFNDESVKESPFAAWKDAYVGVVRMEDGTYQYYWTSDDMAGWRVDLTKDTSLKRGLVYQDASKRVNIRQPIDDREKIVIIDKDGNTMTTTPWLTLDRNEADVCYSFEDLSDTEIMITWYDKNCGKDVIVPAEIGGKLVTKIHNYAFNSMGLTSVNIPESVKTIGSRAFAYNKLTSLYLPESVTEISSEAFLSNKLTSISLGNRLKTMGAACFRHNKLTEAIVPDSVNSLGACSYCDNPIPNPSFLYKSNNGVIDYSVVRGYIGDLTEYPDKVFVIPPVANGVALKTIASSAFSSMSLSDWEVVIPSTVTKIESSAFWACGIKKVNLADLTSLKTIGSSAFDNNHLTEIVIPSSVTTIGDIAFNRNYVTNTEQMWIYDRNADGSVNYSKLIGYAGRNRSNVVIPPTKNGVELTAIRSNAMVYLSLTGTLRIPATVSSVGSKAFCLNNLTHVDNGDGNLNGPYVYARGSGGSIDYTTLVSYAGQGGNVVLPNNIKYLNSYSFYYSNITGVTLPEGLETIGSYAFDICKLGGTLVIPSTVTNIGTNAFRKQVHWTTVNSNLTTIVNKPGLEFNWQDITGGPVGSKFVTGTARSWYGDIQIVSG